MHAIHPHRHNKRCGHTALRHGDHNDYLHDGHLHCQIGSRIAERVIAIDAMNPAGCAPHLCGGHRNNHVHGRGCGHEAVPHGDHVDYLVGDHLHHQHDGHCDVHGCVDIG